MTTKKINIKNEKSDPKKMSNQDQKKQKKVKPSIVNVVEILAFIWDIGKTLIIVVSIAFIIRFYLVQPFYVEGQSMEPNFTDGEYLLIDEISYHFRKPERGEVIVFKPPISTYQNYIKRIIALPNEKISFVNEEVIIINENHPNGKKLKEDYLPPETATLGEKSFSLGENEFFVLGDNRPQSSDSRTFGPLSQKNIVGRVWFYIKTKPWKVLEIFGIKIKIPRITGIGRVIRPKYNIE